MTTEQDENCPEDGGSVPPSMRHLSAEEIKYLQSLWNPDQEVRQLFEKYRRRETKLSGKEISRLANILRQSYSLLSNPESGLSNEEIMQWWKANLDYSAKLISYGYFPKKIRAWTYGVTPATLDELIIRIPGIVQEMCEGKLRRELLRRIENE